MTEERIEEIKLSVALENGFFTWQLLLDGFDKKMINHAWTDVLKDCLNETIKECSESILKLKVK